MTAPITKEKISFTFRQLSDYTDKDAGRAHVIGNLDEVVSYLGLVKSKTRASKDKKVIEKIQRDIITIAAEIAVPEEKKKKFGLIFRKEKVDWIQALSYKLQQKMKIQKYVYLPGKSEISAFLDITGTIARRSERSVKVFFTKCKIKNEHILSYLDGVSSVLFLMARPRSVKKRKFTGKRR